MMKKATFDFSGDTVVVTGASRGIGQGIALLFGAAKAHVIVGYRQNEAGAKTTQAEIEAKGGQATIVAADVTTRAGNEALAEAAKKAGRLSAWVNNAGTYPLHGLVDMTDEDYSGVIRSNLDSVFLGTQIAGRLMKDSGGSIINIASIEGLAPAPLHSHYNAAKAGVIMHTRAAALELGPDGIRVNAVSPGLIHYPELPGLWPEGVARYETRAPLGRLGQREDVAEACLFLASESARFITGTNLVVDGGVSAAPMF